MYSVRKLGISFFVYMPLLSLSLAFNIDEVNSVFYNVNIEGKPIKKGKFDDDVMMIVNRNGQEYACTLPEIITSLQNQTSKEDPVAENDVDISVLLKPMEEAPCLVMTKDWWTYEFCYGKLIKQYHLEDGKISGVELILGRYESEYDWSTGGKGGADASTSGNSNRLQRFHSQFYGNGTKCDLTGEYRKAEVRFKCETDIGDFIERVDEPESCRYILTVATSKVCHHPYLRPHPDRTPHAIRCAPVLDEAKFEAYNRMIERKRKKAEETAASDAAELNETNKSDADISIEVINLSDKLKSLQTSAASLSKDNNFLVGEDILSGSEKEDSTSEDELAVMTEDLDPADDGILVEPDDGTAQPEDKPVADDESFTDSTNHISKTLKTKTMLDQYVENFSKMFQKMTEKGSTSDILKIRDQLSENSAELQELLGDTLSELLEELEALENSAEANKETGKLALWQTLSSKVRSLQKKNEMLNTKSSRDKDELEEGSVEWLKHKLQKNEKVVAKAQGVLGDEINLELNKPASEKSESSMHNEQSEDNSNVGKDSKDEDFYSLLTGKFFEELFESYVADQDSGSKVERKSTNVKKEGIIIKKENESGENKQDSDQEESVMIGSLQESIKNKLKKYGLDVNKHKIEVKILTSGNILDLSGAGDSDKISADQAHSVETLVVQLMGAQKEEILEKERHETLSENYNFYLDDEDLQEEPSSAQPQGNDEHEEK